MALNIKDLGVKFYSSKTKTEALALATLPNGAAEPGAICFVSDNTGNYIIIDGKIFGDGTSGGGGSGGGGAVDSVNGKTGVVVLNLSDFPVIETNGTVLKTLQDYFQSDGSLVTESFKVTSGGEPIVTIDLTGIKFGDQLVATQTWTNIQLGSLETSVKEYADALVTSVYKIKGSVANINALSLIQNPSVGDVYNVISTGMNYVYTSDGWDSLGATIDLSNYYDKSEVNTALSNTLTSANNYTDGKILVVQQQIDTNTTSISNILSTISNQSSAIAENTTNISNNTANISNLATQLTWQ